VALEQSLGGQSPDSTATRLFRQWKKEGKMLRRALQPVRDMDVCLAKLDVLRNTLLAAPIVDLHEGGSKLTQIEKLDARLWQRRQAETENLIAAIDARGKRLRRLSKELVLAGLPNVCITKRVVLEVFEELAPEYTHLNRSNLHTYRKRLKQALYLAEIAAAVDPLAGELAAKLRKIHDVSSGVRHK
jgi:CHAD domain-containing protein